MIFLHVPVFLDGAATQSVSSVHTKKRNMMAAVTLKDIARECNISYSAVSKALNGSTEIGKDTIKLVTETAEKMGYHPNAAAQKLRTNKSCDIGVIFEDKTGSGLQHQYFAKIFDSLNVTANEAGYDITFLNNENKSRRNYYAQAQYRGCDGVVVISTDFSRKDIQELLNGDIPVCTLDFVADKPHPSVLSDNAAGFAALTEYIIAQGHKNIAFIHGEMSGVTKDRIHAFKDTLKRHDINLPETHLVQASYHDPVSSAKATEYLLGLKNAPSCILYPDDFACLGGIQILKEHHREPGKDISIAGYDGILLASLLSPPLTTYEQDGKELGRQLALHLINQIEHPQIPSLSSVLVTGKLIKGNSVGRV